MVLEYRLPKGRPFVPLLDGQRAIRTVRANARTWGVDPGKVGVMGFSAGGLPVALDKVVLGQRQRQRPDCYSRPASNPTATATSMAATIR